MTIQEFEAIAQEEFDNLPELFQRKVENVSIVVERVASPEQLRRAGASHGAQLLGLYEGVPLTRRGSGYGMYATVPDRITLFKDPIESVVHSVSSIREKIREVLIHEMAHYYGMGEKEIRAAGY